MTVGPPPTPPVNGRGASSPAPPEGRHAPSSPLPQAGGDGGGPVSARGQFKPRNTPRARELRNQATPAERQLWRYLNRRQISGHKFSRQMPVGPYFVDFLCREAMLVVEIDGYSHDMRVAHDARRDAFLLEHGYAVLRFSNADVMGNVEGVAAAIALALADRGPPPTPPASERGEERKHAQNP